MLHEQYVGIVVFILSKVMSLLKNCLEQCKSSSQEGTKIIVSHDAISNHASGFACIVILLSLISFAGLSV